MTKYLILLSIGTLMAGSIVVIDGEDLAAGQDEIRCGAVVRRRHVSGAAGGEGADRNHQGEDASFHHVSRVVLRRYSASCLIYGQFGV